MTTGSDYLEVAVWAVIGLAMMLLGWLAWRGHWDTWPNSRIFGPLIITVIPATGLLFVYVAVFTLVGRVSPLALVGVAVFVLWLASWVLYLWRPRWYGPAWYKEFEYDRKQDRAQLSGEILAQQVAPENFSEHLARTARLPEEPQHRVKVALEDPALGKPSAMSVAGLAGGLLLLYTREIVFVGDRTDDILRPGPLIRAIPVNEITDISMLAGIGPLNKPGVRFVSSNKGTMDLRLFGAAKLISTIKRTYAPQRTEPTS